MQNKQNQFRNGVNLSGKTQVDHQTVVRFQKRDQTPWVLAFTKLLNAFGNLISPVKEQKAPWEKNKR